MCGYNQKYGLAKKWAPLPGNKKWAQFHGGAAGRAAIVGNCLVISDKGKEFEQICNISQMIFSFAVAYDIRRYHTRFKRSRNLGKTGALPA
jgi:uncharacterized membrane protein YdcZ (DUF606 family)